jgi:leucyl-tRNA synthetase
MEYKFNEIEAKWKQIWDEKQIYKVTEDPAKPKYYVLDMFPYPSGAGLHVGHPLGYVASDIYARYKRLKGFNVLHPMGYDAFGLPAEQYAIETGTHPAETTNKAIKRYREQLDKIGFSFDWDRKVVTCEPDYYKWTQWIFLQLFNSWYNREKNKAEKIETLIAGFEQWGCTKEWKQFDETLHPPFSAGDWKSFSTKQKERILQCYRLAYRSFTEVNWCEALGCVLANDEVKDGKSERGGYPVTRKKMRQWSLRITEYADRLLEGLTRIDWSDSLKDQQRNWIGRSEGCLLKFSVVGKLQTKSPSGRLLEGDIEVFTTRIDTLFGVSFLVIAPEHPMMESLITEKEKPEMEAYLAYVNSRSDIERQQEKKVTGCFTGSFAMHPFTGKQIPIYTAEYVLAGYGTGAIMAVPADDERDRKFAEKFGLPIIDIVDKSMYPGATIEDKKGKMINSDFLDGMEVLEAIEAMTQKVEEAGIGKRQVNYKLRDASYSRQRYWGEPFPIRYEVQGDVDSPFVDDSIDDEADIPVALRENELPLTLPAVDSFKPTGDGRSPLANSADWVKNRLETDTMPGYAGSSWYYLRYMDPKNPDAFAAKEKLDYWQNVDIYFGGAEHAVGHLLYSRFWHKVLFDLGYVSTDEPFKKLVNQGMITAWSFFVDYVHYLDVSTGKRIQFQTSIRKASDYHSHFEYEGAKYEYPEYVAFGESRLRNAEPYIDSKDRLTERKLNEWINEAGLKDVSPKYFIWEHVYNSKGQMEFLLTEDGERFIQCLRVNEKMSKSKYNVVNPDDVIEKYGADCFRMFEMFLGPIEQSKPWDDKGISGVSNFLKKFWRLFYDDKGWRVTDAEPSDAEYKVLHKTIKKIADDIERLNFNTCISGFMIAVNELSSAKTSSRKILEPLVIALAPFAPFISEELWSALGNTTSVHTATYPAVEQKYLVESTHTYGISINGKVRDEIVLPLDATEAEARAQVLAREKVKQWTQSAEPKKFIFVKGKIINVVV